MRIHLVVNVSRIVQYREQVKGQKKEEGKPVEVEGIKEWKVEKILNKKKIRGVEKYLVWWKGFIAVKITEGGLNFYLALSFLFYFLFHFQICFSIFRTRIRVKRQGSHCHMTGHIR